MPAERGRRHETPAMSDRDDDARTPPPVALAIGAIGLLGAALLSALALVRELHRDEIEHVHAGWLVGQGLRPYTDFFEHHHPLLWYASVPVLRATGETTAAVVGLRMCMLALALGTAWATARLGARATGDAWTGRLAATLLVTMSGFSMIAVEVRPDVPQMLLATLACLWLVRPTASRRRPGVRSWPGSPPGWRSPSPRRRCSCSPSGPSSRAGFGLRRLLREREGSAGSSLDESARRRANRGVVLHRCGDSPARVRGARRRFLRHGPVPRRQLRLQRSHHCRVLALRHTPADRGHERRLLGARPGRRSAGAGRRPRSTVASSGRGDRPGPRRALRGLRARRRAHGPPGRAAAGRDGRVRLPVARPCAED